VSTALLLLVTGLLVWPPPATGGRVRLRAAPLPRLPVRIAPLPAALAAGAAGALLATPLVAGLAAGCAVLATRAWTSRGLRARAEHREQSLVAALGALSAELRAGRPAGAAVRTAARAAGNDALAAEVAVAVHAATGDLPGGSADDALRRVAAAVRLSGRTGASLAEVVSAVEDDLRARRRHRLELASAVAAPRASAALLAGLPLLGLAMGSGVGADPWHVLTRTGTGQVLLVAGVALEVAGLAWARRLVDRASRSAAP
jgi:tight adherence protein B